MSSHGGGDASSEAAVWVHFVDDEGEPYYFHPTTGQNTRNKPTGAVRFVTEAAYLSGEVPLTTIVDTSSALDDWVEHKTDAGQTCVHADDSCCGVALSAATGWCALW